MRIFACFFLLLPAFAFSQESVPYRGSIPEELLRPAKGEAAHYPVDIVIGELGRGRASAAAFSYANIIMAAFISDNIEHPALAVINSVIRESYLNLISVIKPVSFRIGGGRVEPDGAVSFLVRFIGREQGITGELYIRYIQERWTFDELLLEEPRDREAEQQQAMQRLDFFPYERFY